MNTIREAVFALLTHSPEPASVLVDELRHWTNGRVYRGDPKWLPGDVLSALDLLIIEGKAVQVEAGYRLMPDRPKVNPQRGLFE